MSEPEHKNGKPDGRCDAEGPIPTFGPAKRDERGRLLPITREEQQARADAIRRVFALWETEADDDPPGTWEEVMRSIDEERTRLGMRTLFEGYR